MRFLIFLGVDFFDFGWPFQGAAVVLMGKITLGGDALELLSSYSS